MKRTAEEDAGDVVSFSVIDTEIGSTAEQQARLFEPLSQASADTQVRYGGAGPGPTLWREFCRLMGTVSR